MAVLQVNVRPAHRTHPRNGAQRGGQAGDHQTQLRHPPSRDPLQHTLTINNEHADFAAPRDNSGLGWQTVVWTLTPGATIGRALVAATERLRDAGSLTASLDAQVILAHALGVERTWLFAHYDYELTADQAESYTDLIARRTASEPVAYLVNNREFYGLDFYVDRRVLIPRPETELLVDTVFEYIDDYHADSATSTTPIEIVDVGTGSGAIALAVAHEAANVSIHAIDISADALDVARLNAERLGLQECVQFYHGDLLTPLAGTTHAPVHVIVANLPYIRHDDYRALDSDVHDYEPRLALDAGPDGLESIRRLLAQASEYLRPGGMLLLEIGYDQGKMVGALAAEALPRAREISVEKDYSDRDRIVRIML